MSLHTVVKVGNGWRRWKLSLGFGLPGEHRLAVALFSAHRLLRDMMSYCHWPQSVTFALPVFFVLFDIRSSYVIQAGLELTGHSLACADPPASALFLLGFQVCISTYCPMTVILFRC